VQDRPHVTVRIAEPETATIRRFTVQNGTNSLAAAHDCAG
jgi:hypothetical protein